MFFLLFSHAQSQSPHNLQPCAFSLSGDITDLPSLVRRGVSALQATPDLFQSCTRDIVAARRSGMLRRFVSAVQDGPSAIELHASDVLRYTGDMCGWLHVAIASELDFLYALMGAAEDESASAPRFTAPPSVVLKPQSGSTITPSPLICSLLDTIIGSVVPPLCARINACVSSCPFPVLLLKISNIVQFYVQTVAPLLPHDSLAVDHLTEAHAHVCTVSAMQFAARLLVRCSWRCLRADAVRLFVERDDLACPQVVAAFHGALRCLADANSTLLDDLANRCVHVA